MWSAQFEFDSRSVRGTVRDGLKWATSRWTVTDYGLVLAPIPKILTYGPTKTSKDGMVCRKDGMIQDGLVSKVCTYIYIVLSCKEGSTYDLI